MSRLLKKKGGGASRNRYSPEYKNEALALVQKVGVPAAATQLGLHESQLYGWRGKDKLQRDRGEADKQLSVEVVRLKRQLAEQAEELAILKKAAAYFARNQK
jgi:transposase